MAVLGFDVLQVTQLSTIKRCRHVVHALEQRSDAVKPARIMSLLDFHDDSRAIMPDNFLCAT